MIKRLRCTHATGQQCKRQEHPKMHHHHHIIPIQHSKPSPRTRQDPLPGTWRHPQQRHRHGQPPQTRQRRRLVLERADDAPGPVQPRPAVPAAPLALQHAVAHQHPVGLPVLDALEQVRVRLGRDELVAERLDGADLEAQVAELGFVGEDVVFSLGGLVWQEIRDGGHVQVGYLFFEVEDSCCGAFGSLNEEGVEVLGWLAI